MEKNWEKTQLFFNAHVFMQHTFTLENSLFFQKNIPLVVSALNLYVFISLFPGPQALALLHMEPTWGDITFNGSLLSPKVMWKITFCPLIKLEG